MSYLAFVLDGKTRTHLLELIPPSFPDVICHHITIQHGHKDDLAEVLKVYHEYTNPTFEVYAFGKSDEDFAEGFAVMFNGMTFKQDFTLYHITHSIDRSKGAKPVTCNMILPGLINNRKTIPLTRYALSGTFEICN